MKKLVSSDTKLAGARRVATGLMQPKFSPHLTPNRSPAKRVRFGKEEQRRERALTFVKKSEQAIQSLLRRGAGGRTRTGTLSPAVDFESTTSTNSITPASAKYIIPEKEKLGKLFFSKNQRKFESPSRQRPGPHHPGKMPGRYMVISTFTTRPKTLILVFFKSYIWG
jgi:hypothetical protein